MNFTETDLGFVLKKDGYLIFFGKNSANLDQLKTAYPDITFRTVHQKHTDLCIESVDQSSDVIADAHFSSEIGIGLVIKTADCLPILAYSKRQNTFLAIHAGWRGVENLITKKSLVTANLSEGEIFVGPHILQNSFEVDSDVKLQLERTYLEVEQNPNLEIFKFNNEKFYIDLKSIVTSQIKSLKTLFHFNELSIDTVSDLRFHSFRRDKQNSGRNLSFIARLKS